MDFSQFIKDIDKKSSTGIDMSPEQKTVGRVWSAFIKKLFAEPSLWLDAMQEGQKKQMALLSGLQSGETPSIKPKKGDRRFLAEEWHSHPFFSMLMQNYLINSEILRSLANKVDLPKKDKEILLFAIEQYVNAISPSNFPTTNPEVVNEAIKTGGESLAKGAQNFIADMKDNMVKNTDVDAFTVGKDIAITAGKVIFQNAIIQLIEYQPQTKQVYSRPLLIVPPCINKYYILDLTKEKSLINHLVEQGFHVFLVSWVNADANVSHYNLDDYLRDGVMNAIDIVSTITKQQKINTLGFCIGGTLLASALAALAQNDIRPAASMTLLASMLDFSNTGEIGLFIDEDSVAQREKQFAHGGIMDGKDLAKGFAFLRPNDLIWPYVVNNYYQGKKPPPFDLLFWNSDSSNLPGPMFATYLRKAYLENQIAKGNAVMCDVPIDLSIIKVPTYAVACEKDHIVPWETAYTSAKLVDQKARFVLAASGHIAGIVNPAASEKGWFLVGQNILPNNSQKWREKTKQYDGSWWVDWFAWLKKKSGGEIIAPKTCGNVRYPALEDAPGSYVTAPKPKINTGKV